MQLQSAFLQQPVFSAKPNLTSNPFTSNPFAAPLAQTLLSGPSAMASLQNRAALFGNSSLHANALQYFEQLSALKAQVLTQPQVQVPVMALQFQPEKAAALYPNAQATALFSTPVQFAENNTLHNAPAVEASLVQTLPLPATDVLLKNAAVAAMVQAKTPLLASGKAFHFAYNPVTQAITEAADFKVAGIAPVKNTLVQATLNFLQALLPSRGLGSFLQLSQDGISLFNGRWTASTTTLKDATGQSLREYKLVKDEATGALLSQVAQASLPAMSLDAAKDTKDADMARGLRDTMLGVVGQLESQGYQYQGAHVLHNSVAVPQMSAAAPAAAATNLKFASRLARAQFAMLPQQVIANMDVVGFGPIRFKASPAFGTTETTGQQLNIVA